MIADHFLSDRIVSVNGSSDLDIIWDLSWFSEKQIIRTYYDVTLSDILAPQRHQPVHYHSGKPRYVFRR